MTRSIVSRLFNPSSASETTGTKLTETISAPGRLTAAAAKLQVRRQNKPHTRLQKGVPE